MDRHKHPTLRGIAGVLLGLFILWLESTRTPDPNVSVAWVQVGLMILAAALSYLAGQMLMKKQKSPIQQHGPTTLDTRGSFTPWFIGVREVAPVFCWAGDREIKKEKTGGGGKGGGGDAPKTDVYYEAGWHVLGIGPIEALHAVKSGGEVVFEGPITKDSHPSGTFVSTGGEAGDGFTIYWGESDQPINTFLGDADRVTVESRWPHICYVVWNKKRLGSSPVWPIIEYDLERQPINTTLSDTVGWADPGFTSSTDPLNPHGIKSVVADADPDTGYFQITGDHSVDFRPGYPVDLAGNAKASGTYTVRATEIVHVGFFSQRPETRVFLEEGTAGADDNGTLEWFVGDMSGGANIAHVISEMLFEPFPQGVGIDPDHAVETWDLLTLEDLGTEVDGLGWRASVLATEGEQVEAALGKMLQDHSTLLPLDPTTGALVFNRVREPSGAIPNVPSEIVAENPEIETLHSEAASDRLIFSFTDRENAFSEMTLTIDDDGQASYLEHQRARTVGIHSTVHFDTAAAISEQRAPEESAFAGEFRLQIAREARDLAPGDAITVDGIDEVVRVIGVELSQLSEAVKIKVLPDFFGVPASSFIVNPAPSPTAPQGPAQDEQFIWLEIPEHLLGDFPATQAVAILRIRDNSQMSFTTVWFSRDGASYTLIQNSSLNQTGGILTEALSEDGPTFVEQGPEYEEAGPDNASLTQDLSADLTNWGLGRQLAVIASENGVEVCFLQKATIVTSTERRLDGLLRGRYDTRKLDHPADESMVFIFDIDEALSVEDALLEPDEALFLKSQPGSSGGQVALGDVASYDDTLYGKGQVPVAPDYVYVRAPEKNVAAYATGDNITFSWALSTGSRGTGAGMQSAGTPISTPAIPGTVQIQFLDSGDTLQETVGVDADDTEYELTNADLQTIFSGEPASFKVKITHVANGQSSDDSPVLTVTKI